MTERVNHERVLKFLCTCQWQRYNEWFLSLFIWLLCLYWGGGNGESLTGEEFCGKSCC